MYNAKLAVYVVESDALIVGLGWARLTSLQTATRVWGVCGRSVG